MKVRNFLISLLMMAPMASQAADRSGLDQARAAAEKYADLQVALAEGFQPLFGCIYHLGEGAMGSHYIHPGRADAVLEPAEPEVLMYEPQADGSMQLVAVEHVVFEKDWSGKDAPRLFGQPLKRKTAVGPHPVDPFYEIHLWHWRDNPEGVFADWNPRVSCQHG